MLYFCLPFTPIFKKWWFWIIIIVVLAVAAVAIVIIAASTSPKSESAKNNKSDNASISEKESDESDSMSASDQEVDGSDSADISDQVSEDSVNTTFAVGDVIHYEDKEITVVSVERDYRNYNVENKNQFLRPETGEEYIKIKIKIINKSNEKISYSPVDWSIQDGDGNSQEVAGLQYYVDGALNNGLLEPNSKLEADLYFKVPKGDTELTLHYIDQTYSVFTMNIKL